MGIMQDVFVLGSRWLVAVGAGLYIVSKSKNGCGGARLRQWLSSGRVVAVVEVVAVVAELSGWVGG